MYWSSYLETGVRAVCNYCPYLLLLVPVKEISIITQTLTKIDLLDTSLLKDKLHQKVYITSKILEPWSILTEIKVSDRVNSRVKEGFENKLPDVFINVYIFTEFMHVKGCNRRVELDDLSQQAYDLNSTIFR